VGRVVAQGRIKKRFDRWDSDGSGELMRSDFEREAEKIAATFGHAPSARATAQLREALGGLFELCAHQAELPPAGPITEAQFRKVAEDFIFEQGEAAFNRALRPVVAGIVGVCDGDDDGRMGRSEFTRWLSVLGLDADGAAAAFECIDADGRGTLSERELLAAIRDYHYGRLNVELIAG
jgi:Ca2+-binding EF-hand superfamily protein